MGYVKQMSRSGKDSFAFTGQLFSENKRFILREFKADDPSLAYTLVNDEFIVMEGKRTPRAVLLTADEVLQLKTAIRAVDSWYNRGNDGTPFRGKILTKVRRMAYVYFYIRLLARREFYTKNIYEVLKLFNKKVGIKLIRDSLKRFGYLKSRHGYVNKKLKEMSSHWQKAREVRDINRSILKSDFVDEDFEDIVGF